MNAIKQLESKISELTNRRASILDRRSKDAEQLEGLKNKQVAALIAGMDTASLESQIATLTDRTAGYSRAIQAIDDQLSRLEVDLAEARRAQAIATIDKLAAGIRERSRAIYAGLCDLLKQAEPLEADYHALECLQKSFNIGQSAETYELIQSLASTVHPILDAINGALPGMYESIEGVETPAEIHERRKALQSKWADETALAELEGRRKNNVQVAQPGAAT